MEKEERGVCVCESGGGGGGGGGRCGKFFVESRNQPDEAKRKEILKTKKYNSSRRVKHISHKRPVHRSKISFKTKQSRLVRNTYHCRREQGRSALSRPIGSRHKSLELNRGHGATTSG